jgi:hypothetical protein
VAGCRREPVAIGSQFGSQILSTPLVSECLNTASVTAVASAWRYVWLKRLQAALLGRFGVGSGPTLVGQRFSAARTGPTSELVFLFGAGLSGAVSERQFADQVEPDEAAMVGPKQAAETISSIMRRTCARTLADGYVACGGSTACGR